MSSTNEFRQYKHPPITEAVIGVVFESNVDAGVVNKAQKKLEKAYPNHQQLRQIKMQFKVAHSAVDATKEFNEEDVGHRRSTNDQAEIAILQRNSITISQLAPYVGWDAFSQRFKRDWSLVKGVTGFRTIKQVGVRYINRVDIPFEGEGVRIGEYLTATANVPDGFGPLSGYSVSAEVRMTDIHCVLRLNTGAVPSPLPKCVSVILDLDLIRTEDVPQSDGDISEILEVMRDRKNAFFEASITQKARELFANERI